ncbi:MAG: 4Fe-4S dicluster domain-containing protein [Desulfurivibrio sp.]|nr:4Fe-4S dicluster domain-containing protein [Desulfurivibrio sp.]
MVEINPKRPPAPAPALLYPWRRRLQLLGVLLFLALPWWRLGGESVLRFDLPAGIFYFAGRPWRLEEFYFLGLGLLILLFAFLLLTLVLGRVWCGWLCPQTWLAEFIEGVARRLGLEVAPRQLRGTRFRLVLLHLLALLVAVVPAVGLVCYFMPPELYWRRLLAGNPGPWQAGATLVLVVFFYVSQVWIRRLACLDFCPYGRFQALLLDAGTLVLRLPPKERGLCLNCRACVRVCPLGLDIRQGYQGQCINCATCLDACRRVMARRRQPGLIRYTFGTGERGWRALFSPRLGLLLVVLLLVVAATFYLGGERDELSLQIRRVVPTESRQQADGGEIVLFSASLGSRAATAGAYRLRAVTAEGRSLELLGPADDLIELEPGERRQLDFAVELPAAVAAESPAVFFQLVDDAGRVQASQRWQR